jgi:hypothetical protein
VIGTVHQLLYETMLWKQRHLNFNIILFHKHSHWCGKMKWLHVGVICMIMKQ